MVKIVGSEKEVKLLIEMLDNTSNEACTSATIGMKCNEFCVQGRYDSKDLDFMVEYEFIK